MDGDGSRGSILKNERYASRVVIFFTTICRDYVVHDIINKRVSIYITNREIDSTLTTRNTTRVRLLHHENKILLHASDLCLEVHTHTHIYIYIWLEKTCLITNIYNDKRNTANESNNYITYTILYWPCIIFKHIFRHVCVTACCRDRINGTTMQVNAAIMLTKYAVISLWRVMVGSVWHNTHIFLG